MKNYTLFSWEKEKLFREKHYIRKSSEWNQNLFVCCNTFFESEWFEAYKPPHYAISRTLYEFLIDGSYCHMDKERMLTELHPGDWIITQLDSEPTGRYDRVLKEPLLRIGLLVPSSPVHDALKKVLFPEKRAILHTNDCAPFLQLLQEIKNEISGAGRDPKISILMIQLLQDIATLRNQALTSFSNKFSDIIRECHSESWHNVAEIASHFGMSERTMTRLFKENLDTTPGRYLAEIRLNKAKQLLSVLDLEIKEIASLCGYASANFLTRCFRQKYHISPREYRNGVKESQ